MTEQPISDLEFMTNPHLWPNDPILPLKRRSSTAPTAGILVAGPMGRFVWYEGANMWASKEENAKFLANSKVLLAPQLQTLIEEGWEVD